MNNSKVTRKVRLTEDEYQIIKMYRKMKKQRKIHIHIHIHNIITEAFQDFLILLNVKYEDNKIICIKF